jgi:HEAT repeat protein
MGGASVLGKFPDDEATRAIVSVVQDPMASVRKAAATALAGRSSSEAHSALLRLLRDTTDTSDARVHYTDDPIEIEFGVAQAAACTLSGAKPWSSELVAAVTAFLESDAATARNRELRRLLGAS